MAGLVNGLPLPHVEIADRGFQYGDGVFTTIRVHRGMPMFFERHIARLRRDCARLSIPFADFALLEDEVNILCQDATAGVLKIQITRGLGGRGYRCPDHPVPTRVLGLHPMPDFPADLLTTGIEIRLCQSMLGMNPQLAGIKHMNRLEQILARHEWEGLEPREGLMRDGEGFLVEGTMSNLFLVLDGVLCTPLLDRCGVAGVVRGLVLEWAQSNRVEIEECRIPLDALLAADEVFVTNSVIGLWPVTQFQDVRYRVGPVALGFQAWLMARMEAQRGAACTG